MSATHENVVAVHPGLHFAVGLRNGSLRRKLTVTMWISGGTLGSPTVRRQTIILRPHAGAAVRLGDLVGEILFAQRETPEGRGSGYRAPRNLVAHLPDHLLARLNLEA